MKDKKFSVQVGNYIAERRKKAGLSQPELADRLGVTPETISRMESGKITLSVERIREFAEILQCEPSDLLRPIPTEEPEILTSISNLVKPLHEKQQKFIRDLIYETCQLLKKMQ